MNYIKLHTGFVFYVCVKVCASVCVCFLFSFNAFSIYAPLSHIYIVVIVIFSPTSLIIPFVKLFSVNWRCYTCLSIEFLVVFVFVVVVVVVLPIILLTFSFVIILVSVYVVIICYKCVLLWLIFFTVIFACMYVYLFFRSFSISYYVLLHLTLIVHYFYFQSIDL